MSKTEDAIRVSPLGWEILGKLQDASNTTTVELQGALVELGEVVISALQSGKTVVILDEGTGEYNEITLPFLASTKLLAVLGLGSDLSDIKEKR
jgi:hypothetical protein